MPLPIGDDGDLGENLLVEEVNGSNMSEEFLTDIFTLREVLASAWSRISPLATAKPTLSVFPIAFGYGLETHDGAAALISVGRSRQATLLARSFHELSIQCLWAAREPDGVARLIKTAVDDERSQWQDVIAHGATSLPPDAADASSAVLKGLDELRLSAGVTEQTKHMPNVRQMLEAIHERDRGEKLRTQPGAMNAVFHYVVGYRFPSATTHANLVALLLHSNESHLHGVRAILGSAVIALCRATRYTLDLPMDDLVRAAATVMQRKVSG